MKRLFSLPALLIASLLVGVATFTRYGESWDVNSMEHYADASLALYGYVGSNRVPEDVVSAESLALGNYGPAFMMFVRAVDAVVPPSDDDVPFQLQHLLYFLSFLVGVAAFHVLCRRWMRPEAATAAALLMLSQPVLWGHAFINPKDIPFLALFLVAVVTGLSMVDRLELPSDGKAMHARLLLPWLIPILVIFLGSGAILNAIGALVSNASAGTTNIVSVLASDIHSVPPETYIARYGRWFVRAAFVFMLFGSGIWLLLVRRYSRPLHRTLMAALPAGILVGVAAAIRNLGLGAALIVCAYLLLKHRRSGLLLLMAYLGVAATVLFLLWPYLWFDPAGRLIESFRVMSRYPWTDPILFNGQHYLGSALPPTYLPALLAVQLTEPVWLLVAAGLVLSVRRWQTHRGLIWLVAGWFVLPVLVLVIARPVLYDNFRQVLFILPPIFLLAGLTFDRVTKPAMLAVLTAVCILPGVLGVMRLFPYEYTYYNTSVGGVDGAFRRFEMDYWGTSYREAAEYLNENAPAGAAVWVEGPAHLFQKYARADLNVYSTHEAERAPSYDYAVATTRFDLDLTSFPDAPVVFEISRGEAVLTVVKQP